MQIDLSFPRSQTTKGIWLARCAGIEPCTLVMDLEGTDGRERGEVHFCAIFPFLFSFFFFRVICLYVLLFLLLLFIFLQTFEFTIITCFFL